MPDANFEIIAFDENNKKYYSFIYADSPEAARERCKQSFPEADGYHDHYVKLIRTCQADEVK